MRATAALAASCLLALAGPARAEVTANGSGFVTVAAGRIFGGSSDPATDSGFRCPCLPAEYAQGGVYEAGAWRWGPDSKLGLQGTLDIADGRLSATGQVVARGAKGGRANLEWLYASVDLGSRLTLQVGRKRLPLLAQSEVQDVGYALPWVHLPPQLYGWEIVNFNGASVLYRDRWGAASAAINIFGGRETVTDSPFAVVYSGRNSRTDTRWTGIAGADARIALDGIELRAGHVRSNTQNRAVSDGDTAFSAPARQRIWSLGLSYDVNDWVGRAEWLYVDRRADYGTDRSALYALGRRYGPWLPMLSWSRYRQHASTSGEPAEGHDMTSVLLRYELKGGAAVKLQLDSWIDRSDPGFAYPHGDRRLLTVAYVRVF